MSRNPALRASDRVPADPTSAPMTYDDVLVRTGGLLLVVVMTAAATWFLAPGLLWVGAIAGFVLAMVNIFRSTPSPTLITLYAVCEGMFLGGLSHAVEARTLVGESAGTLVTQAVLGTLVTFAVSLLLYRSGWVRVTAGFRRFVLIALVSYLGFSVVNLILSFFLPHEGFGPMRSGWVGLAVGVLAVVLAAMALITDFDDVRKGVEGRAPQSHAWTLAFGLVVTLVWLYTELLRIFEILAIFGSD